ncbi:hypothetical protein E1091_08425 [Micromonospora fluostatini]|uniref:HTH cro/C1-type domain-containing protein n=1 Tax=Micromonospora fluostatini TaxID=1629071 RepID=A0ABY2DMM9_9ACTN|nr:hypothetical protein E1091_08425 [Micromonospora fluostatini]
MSGSSPTDLTQARAELGKHLAQARKAAGYTQETLAPLTHYVRSTIANVERGRQNVNRDFWVRCDTILNTGGSLAAGYDRLREIASGTSTMRESDARAVVRLPEAGSEIPDRHPERHDPGDQDPFGSSTAFSVGTADPSLVPHWMGMLRILAASHDVFGPRRIYDVVRGEIAIIHQAVATTTGRSLSELQRVEARWAELASWTADNLGDSQNAEYWLRHALALSTAARDRRTAAYVLMRQAQRAAERHDAPRALALAHASTHNSTLTARDQALCAVRRAQAHAIAGDSAACGAALQAAHKLVAVASDGDDPDTIGHHCGLAYIVAHEGQCHTLLDRPKQAVTILNEVLRSWPSTYRQDEGLARVWLATAYALLGHLDEAIDQAEQALSLAAEAGSLRLTRALRRVDVLLAPHRAKPQVEHFRARYALAHRLSGTMAP